MKSIPLGFVKVWLDIYVYKAFGGSSIFGLGARVSKKMGAGSESKNGQVWRAIAPECNMLLNWDLHQLKGERLKFSKMCMCGGDLLISFGAMGSRSWSNFRVFSQVGLIWNAISESLYML